MNPNFWRNKKVLVTGHTGFKGSWICLWLQSLGAEVIGIALQPPTEPNLFSLADTAKNMISVIGNVNDFELVKGIQDKYQPEIVFHMAAQSLVRYSYHNPVETYASNVMGTVNLLESVRQSKSPAKVLIAITSDKCYENKEQLDPYQENDRLGGYDPYSNSKACAELVTAAFRSSYYHPQKSKSSLGIATVRAGNVIGGGDWAEDRLIPDIIRSLRNNKEMIIRYPYAIRPWQHVLEPLSGYMLLAEKMYHSPAEYSEAWNFGPDEESAKSVSWIIDQFTHLLGSNLSWKIDSDHSLHEAHYLKLDSSKARSRLNWQPRWNIEKALLETVRWYQGYLSGSNNIKKITLAQIENYTATLPKEVLVNG